MLEEVTADTLTEVGAADGAEGTETLQLNKYYHHEQWLYFLPASRVIAVTVLLTALLPAALLAVTVML